MNLDPISIFLNTYPACAQKLLNYLGKADLVQAKQVSKIWTHAVNNYLSVHPRKDEKKKFFKSELTKKLNGYDFSKIKEIELYKVFQLEVGARSLKRDIQDFNEKQLFNQESNELKAYLASDEFETFYTLLNSEEVLDLEILSQLANVWRNIKPSKEHVFNFILEKQKDNKNILAFFNLIVVALESVPIDSVKKALVLAIDRRESTCVTRILKGRMQNLIDSFTIEEWEPIFKKAIYLLDEKTLPFLVYFSLDKVSSRCLSEVLPLLLDDERIESLRIILDSSRVDEIEASVIDATFKTAGTCFLVKAIKMFLGSKRNKDISAKSLYFFLSFLALRCRENTHVPAETATHIVKAILSLPEAKKFTKDQLERVCNDALRIGWEDVMIGLLESPLYNEIMM